MQIGLVGVGAMGLGMVRHLSKAHEVVAFDVSPQALESATRVGAGSASSLVDLVAFLEPPRAVLVMLPPGAPSVATLAELGSLLGAEDVLIDGGNTHYRASMARAESLAESGIHFVDMGTSGGTGGAENGYALMLGGSEPVIRRLAPIFDSLTPAHGPGWAPLGPHGAGHFAKMVHNQVKHGIEQAYAEGLATLSHAHEFTLDLHTVTQVWSAGAMARSAILDLINEALTANPELGALAPYVADSGAANWNRVHAVDQMVQRGYDREQLV